MTNTWSSSWHEDFEREVLTSDLPVLVDFHADWCHPSRWMAPEMEELARDFAGCLRVWKVDVERNRRLARGYGVLSVPTLILFDDEEAVAAMTGYPGRFALRKWMCDVLTSLRSDGAGWLVASRFLIDEERAGSSCPALPLADQGDPPSFSG